MQRVKPELTDSNRADQRLVYSLIRDKKRREKKMTGLIKR